MGVWIEGKPIHPPYLQAANPAMQPARVVSFVVREYSVWDSIHCVWVGEWVRASHSTSHHDEARQEGRRKGRAEEEP